MKRFIVFAVAGVVTAGVLAQNSTTNTTAPTNTIMRISAAEARDHIGAFAVVTGKVAEVHATEKVVRLNLGQAFPKQSFTGVIFAANTNRFPAIERLKGQEVEIRGKIAEYRGRPEIILTGTNQLKVVGK